MKILINTSNIYVGGAVQVSISFINELNKLNIDNNYYILLSLELEKQIDKSTFDNRFTFFLIEYSPSSLINRKDMIKRLNKIENKVNPNVVFTVFGPSYWKPKSNHIMGFADGWVYNEDSVAYDKIGYIPRLKRLLLNKYKLYYLNRDADYIIVETSDAKNKLSRLLNIEINNIFVVGNTYSDIFNKSKEDLIKDNSFIKLPKRTENEIRLMYISYNHPAKNLNIINSLIPYLRDLNIKFVLTIDNSSFNKMFKNKEAEDYIINMGTISVSSCPSLYIQCDYLFAPTLLETFSAAYPESMKMNLPILTSHFSFAKDICQDSAVYFDPLNPRDIVEKIISIINNKKKKSLLIDKGNKQLLSFETANSRAKKYIIIFEKVNNV